MTPPDFSQAPDDPPTSGQDIVLNTMNHNENIDRLSSKKLSLETNEVNKDSIHGIKYFENQEAQYDDDSVDLSSPDSPASTLMTDSCEEEFTDDEQLPSEQPSGTVFKSAVYDSSSHWQFTKQPPDTSIKHRRPLHDKKENYQEKEERLAAVKDKFSELIEKFGYKVLFIAITFIAILICLMGPLNESSPKSMKYYMSDEILHQYPSQDKLDMRNLIRVINNVNQGNRETDKVAVITMLYSHRETAECLAKSAASYAVKVINKSKDFLRLNGSLSNADFYLSNEAFKKNVEGKGVLVVYDFHNFPADKVRFFHAICDKHTPYIEDKAVYIILLETSKNQEEISKKLEKVKSRVEELWYSLSSEILYPLATRLMENVMFVQQEPKLLWC